VISHDLREPLRAVRNFANLIRDRYSGNLDDKGRDFLGRIIRAAERLDRQLEDVLTLSRAQRLIAPNELVPLRQVVADVLHQLELRIQETHA
jgi:light-regulated signal transduction histidine kinase (bacteriophytochrome)